MILRELQVDTRKWRERNFPDPAHRDVSAQMMGCTEELGELAHAILKMRQGIRGTKTEHMEAAEDAVGDLLIYLCGVCDTLGLSIDDAAKVAWDNIKDRDWIKYPTNGKDA